MPRVCAAHDIIAFGRSESSGSNLDELRIGIRKGELAENGNIIVEFALILPLFILFALFIVDLGLSISEKALMVDQSRIIAREMMRHKFSPPDPDEMCAFAHSSIEAVLAAQGVVVDVSVQPFNYNFDYWMALWGGTPMFPPLTTGAEITISRNEASRPTYFGNTGFLNSVTIVVPLVNGIQNVSSTVSTC